MSTDTFAKWSESKDQIYVNIKATACDHFCPIEMSDYVLNKKFPWMVARHVHGKTEGTHYHIVGVKKVIKGKPIAHQDYDHPLKEVNKKPIQCKKQLYDFGAFMYCVKPKEWATGGCVIQSCFTDEQLEHIAAESNAYFEAKKSCISTMLTNIEPGDDEDAESFHMRLKDATIAKIYEEKGTYHPHYRNTILTAMLKHKRYHPYMRKHF